ncbi:MAG TPA: SRPBCC domain-containing protein [Burkholderiales bacterium]|nr:SRPBCC domain-containing protein [Burkholderiales bacterium]
MKHLLTPRKNGRSRAMTEPPAAIRVTRRFSAPPERVFRAWLDPEVAGKWLFATALHPMTGVEIDPRIGGSFRLTERRDGEIVEHAGKYIDIVPHRRLVFALSAADQPRIVARVTVDISPLKTGCEIALTHESVPRDDANQTEGRWTGILYGLGATLGSRAGRSAIEGGRTVNRRAP